MGTISVDKVEPGDILLVTPYRDPLARMIVDLDRSWPEFSHCGLANGDGGIVSSYPNLDGVVPLDLGGLHHDSYAHFTEKHQSIHRLLLPDGADREKAAAKLKEYPEERDGAFAWAKIVMVAAALHVLDPGRPLAARARYEVVSRAIEVGERWRSDDDFFCAEFAATLYEIPFTVGDLRPPVRATLVFPEVVQRAIIAVGTGLLTARASDEQRKALKALVATIWRYAPGFFDHGLDVLWEEAKFAARELTTRMLVPEDEPLLDDTLLVPPALATPRMVFEWGKGTVEVAAAIPQPPSE